MSTSYFDQSQSNQDGYGPKALKEKNKSISKRYFQKYSSLTPEQKERAGTRAEFSAKRKDLGLKGVNVGYDTKTRMAGDALNELRNNEGANQNTVDELNKKVYGVKDINKFDAAASGRGSENNDNRLSKSDIKGLKKYGGFTEEQIVQYAEDNPDIKTGGDKAQKLLAKYKDRIAAKQVENSTPPAQTTEENPQSIPTPGTSTTPIKASGSIDTGDSGSNINEQKADNNVTQLGAQIDVGGDNNGFIDASQESTINNNFENNSKYYEASDKNMVVNSVNGGSVTGAVDGLATAGTLGGMYDVDDSPAGVASRKDLLSGLNQDGQKYWQKESATIAQDAIDKAFNNAYTNPDGFDERLIASEQNDFDKAKMMGNNIFGDIFAYGGAPTWKSPKPAETVKQPDFKTFANELIDGL